MTDDTDAALIVRCRNGDRIAFDALLSRYERQVFSAAFRILHNREDAIDVTQTAFLRAYEHFDRYDAGQRFDSWVYRIAVNEALDLVRARRHPNRWPTTRSTSSPDPRKPPRTIRTTLLCRSR